MSKAAYAVGHLLFVRGGNLMAQPFDIRTLEMGGEAVPIVDHVNFSPAFGWADFSASQDGAIAIGASGRRPLRMTWFDRAGQSLGAFGAEGRYQFVSLSPDQTRVAVDAPASTSGYALFILDPARGTTTQLTVSGATGNFPVWSPDGARIAFASSRDGVYNLYVKSSNGSSPDELLRKSERNKFLMDWSRDGRYLIFSEQDPKTRNADLWLLPMTGEHTPILYVHGDSDKRDAHFSPDGRWVAYTSDESRRMQVYVQSFPVASERWQVSTDGGGRPRWRDDSKELYYMDMTGRLMALEVKTGAGFEAGAPKLLFETGLVNNLINYAVARGGQRFVMPAHEVTAADPVTVILNWPAGLKK